MLIAQWCREGTCRRSLLWEVTLKNESRGRGREGSEVGLGGSKAGSMGLLDKAL